MNMTLSERADALEEQQLHEFERLIIAKSVLYTSGDEDPTAHTPTPRPQPGQRLLMGPDPRLRPMPAQPTLRDFFERRLSPGTRNHLLQSARLALKAGHSEAVVIASLLHDFAVGAFIRADHGYYGAQLAEPYVTEEVSWAIRAHQALRFYPDESVGYTYPQNYIRWFGDDYQPEQYIEEAYCQTRNHRWYMTARLITLDDLYSFDPDVVVSIDEFEDIIGRNFKQPDEGLGFDGSPVAHMWRTMIWPTRFL